MLTEKDYCDYETCVALKELECRIQTEWYIHQPSYERGGCYLCFGIPRETSVLDECDYIPRLSLYEAQKWLREEHDMCVHICRPHMNKGSYVWSYEVVFCGCGVSSRGFFLSYEEALSEGLRASIKILQDEQKENN